MATPEQDQRWYSLAEEATCPICLGYFEKPVSVQCGHTFCNPCISRYWEGVQGSYPCPQCRETAPTKTLRPNLHLANIVQILAQGPPVAPPSEGLPMCAEHDEKLKLFCQEDQTPICVICRESRDHRTHSVTPIGEAAQEYQDKFRGYLDDVKRKLESALGLQKKEEAKWRDLEEKFKTQKERITTVFDQVQRFLEEEKCRHLSNLEEKETRALQRSKEKVSKLSSEQALLQSQITEIESKCQQPDLEFLKDVKSVLARFENVKSPHSCSGHLKELGKEIWKHEAQGEVEKKDMKKMGEEEQEEEEDVADLLKKIIESLEWRWARSFADSFSKTGQEAAGQTNLTDKLQAQNGRAWHRGAVTLDPDTAHQRLVLSADQRSVRDGDRVKHLRYTPERFNLYPYVLGRERLSAGRRYWEVEVGDKTCWKLGVCDESMSRKGAIPLSPEGGHWAVWLWDGVYRALTSPTTPLAPRVAPRVVGLFLDRKAGRFSVYNVTDRSLLFTFPRAPFPRTLQPLFGPGFSDGGQNAGPLRVMPVTED